jgi:SAM-dependent methyltransferase
MSEWPSLEMQQADWSTPVLCLEGIVPSGDDPFRYWQAVDWPEDEQADADEQYHDGEAPRYDQYLQDPRIAAVEAWLLPRLVAYCRDGITVDLGCGTGRVTRALVARGQRVVAVDRSLEMLRRVAGDIPAGQVALLRSDARKLPINSSSCDSVVCSGVLHHMARWPEVVAECARVLRPGGRLIIREPNADYWAVPFAVVERVIGWLNELAGARPNSLASVMADFVSAPYERPISIHELLHAAAGCGLRSEWGSTRPTGEHGL